ncbi:ATP-binding cassette domain-containing protein [Cardiobacteriaceae bacterium TAE3-ERU3]|nr:ATP-binding cassette domain-containing protein [Cardiobacteriaceae bacterium TAE3-ERU3]
MTDAIASLRGMTFRRGKRIIFDNIDVDFPAGEVIAVMGPSGTGKTTLMKIITGQLKVDCGEVTTLGKRLNGMGKRQLMALRSDMSMLFQSGALFSDMTVGANVAFPLREKTKLSDELIDIIVDMKLQRVGLLGARDLMPSELSGGMARRAALARAIVRDPKLMIYDEPFTGQDPISLGVLARLVRDLNDSLGMTSIVVSHDIAEASRIADRIILIAGGRVVANDCPDALYASDDPLVHQFMHAESDGPVPYHYPGMSYSDTLLGVK